MQGQRKTKQGLIKTTGNKTGRSRGVEKRRKMEPGLIKTTENKNERSRGEEKRRKPRKNGAGANKNHRK